MAEAMDDFTILAVEDDPLFGDALLSLLQTAGYRAQLADSLQEARRKLDAGVPDLFLLDMSLPDGSGTDLIAEIRERCPRAVILCLSAYLDVPTIVHAMRAGADDYLVKTDPPPELLKRLEGYARRARGRTDVTVRPTDLFVRSPAMEPVDRLVRLASQTSSTVLLSGETGTGKSFTARLIHRFSDRADKPFVTVDCAALSESLAESELFGHERGAFTGALNRRVGVAESARDGTLFFDEIADLPMSIQGKLLRILDERVVRRVGGMQEHSVKARVIGATRRDLRTLVEEGRFREDLYFRLSVLEIPLPPLRERRDDVLPLAEHLIQSHIPRPLDKLLTPQALLALAAYDYPGNVRELRNVVERLALMRASTGGVATMQTVHMAIGQTSRTTGCVQRALDGEPSDDIGQALVAAGGRIGDAARSLGISRHALRRRLKKLQHTAEV